MLKRGKEDFICQPEFLSANWFLRLQCMQDKIGLCQTYLGYYAKKLYKRGFVFGNN